MKKIIMLAIALLIGLCPQIALAKGKSFNIRVSCVVPQRLELALPQTQTYDNAQTQEEPIIQEDKVFSSNKIRTQQIRDYGHQKAIVYTIVER